MRNIYWILLVAFFITTGCSNVPQEKALTLANAGAVDEVLLERLRQFVEDQLHVPVRAVEQPQLAEKKGFQSLRKSAERLKTDADVTLIVLSGFEDDSTHLTVYEENGIAIVNATPLYTDHAETFARRLERQIMRAAAFSFGLPPTPDPYCVTRNYKTLEDLDRMGKNYSPPWQGRYADEARKRGLEPSGHRKIKSPSIP